MLNPSEGSLRRKYWPCFGERLYSQRPRKTCEIMVLQKQPFHNPPVHNMHICNMGRQPGKLALDLFILSPTLSISWWKTSQWPIHYLFGNDFPSEAVFPSWVVLPRLLGPSLLQVPSLSPSALEQILSFPLPLTEATDIIMQGLRYDWALEQKRKRLLLGFCPTVDVPSPFSIWERTGSV